MADQEGCNLTLLRQAKQPPRSLTHLADRAGRGAKLRRVKGLNRVDHADLRALPLERRNDLAHVRLGEDPDVAGTAEPVGAKLHLRGRFLARDENDLPRLGHLAESHQKKSGLPDSWVAADEDERGRDEAAAENTIELGDPGRESLRVGRLDLDEPEERPALRCRPTAGRRGGSFLDE